MLDLALKMLLGDKANYIMLISGLTFASLPMVMLQTLTVGLIGYGCGVGLATLFGMIVIKKGMPPYFLPWQLPVITLVAILFICWLAASLGIRKIKSLEPAVVFRG